MGAFALFEHIFTCQIKYLILILLLLVIIDIELYAVGSDLVEEVLLFGCFLFEVDIVDVCIEFSWDNRHDGVIKPVHTRD